MSWLELSQDRSRRRGAFISLLTDSLFKYHNTNVHYKLTGTCVYLPFWSWKAPQSPAGVARSRAGQWRSTKAREKGEGRAEEAVRRGKRRGKELPLTGQRDSCWQTMTFVNITLISGGRSVHRLVAVTEKAVWVNFVEQYFIFTVSPRWWSCLSYFTMSCQNKLVKPTVSYKVNKHNIKTKNQSCIFFIILQ